jgi:hypothetical protein
MRKLVLMLIVGLAAFVLVLHVAEAKGVTLTKGQVQTVCDGKTECQKNCGLQGADTCQFKCKGDKCEGKCLSCGSVSRHVFPNLYSKRAVRQAVRRSS